MPLRTPALDRAREEARVKVREEDRLRRQGKFNAAKQTLNAALRRVPEEVGGSKAERLERALDDRDAPATGRGLDQGAHGGTRPVEPPSREQIAKGIDDAMRRQVGVTPRYTEEDE
jgi:hypothetical protein